MQITTTSDLLKAKNIQSQIMTHGPGQVKILILASVEKLLEGLNIVLDENKINMLCNDLMLKYKYDSIEDIQECLKKGRIGNYGKNYGKIDMIVISEWMSKHLEEKSIAREHQNNDKFKHTWETKEEYVAAVKKGLEEQEKETNQARRERIKNEEYERFKAEYLRTGKPEGTIKKES